MWLEIKTLLTIMGTIFTLVAVIIGASDLLVILLVFMGISFIILGDIMIGYQITSKECKPLIDPTPPGKELTCFQEIGGKIHFKNTEKGEMGVRRFMWHDKVGAVINDGAGMFTSPNGNRGFFSHESYDKNISMILCKAIEDASRVLDARDSKEIYEKAFNEIHKLEKERVHFDRQQQ